MGMSPRLLRPRASGFNPKSIANLQLWLDASSVAGMRQLSDGTTTVAANADPVGYWPDLSGNGYHATQSTTNNRPTYRTAVRNGRSVLRFDGLNDSCRVASFPLDATSSLFVVAQFNTAGTSGNATGNLFIEHAANTSGGGAINNNGIFWCGQDKPAIFVRRSPSFVRAIDGQQSWVGTDWGVFDFRVAAAANAVASMTYWKNGVVRPNNSEYLAGGAGTGSITSGQTVTAQLCIGSRNQASVFSNGDYAEILIYNRPLTDAEHSSVRRSLGSKWGVTVA